ncbi:MAG: hypothetical protein QF747_02545 [Patescibacteria group bacterium]|nr:hypothetical protein [Patescibacteria group bacterium]MDP6756525.1 hypothetical protein [Patescibacteria group bacterium]
MNEGEGQRTYASDHSPIGNHHMVSGLSAQAQCLGMGGKETLIPREEGVSA